MNTDTSTLGQAVDSVLETLPPVWDRIRTNLRAAGTSKFGITLDQFHTLRFIRHGYCSVKDLAQKRQISRPAISQVVDALVKKGLVTRLQESEDRRCVHLALTPNTSEVLDANYEDNRLWMREKMASLTREELVTIQEAMKTLRDTFAPEELRA
jgi:DNA-binding MarR family transcriptional regulator